jgi:hypothetical protein
LIFKGNHPNYKKKPAIKKGSWTPSKWMGCMGGLVSDFEGNNLTKKKFERGDYVDVYGCLFPLHKGREKAGVRFKVVLGMFI